MGQQRGRQGDTELNELNGERGERPGRERGSERNRTRNRNWEGLRWKEVNTERDRETENLGAGVGLDLTRGGWGALRERG